MSIGNNIRTIRKRNGMTLKQIADIIGCSPQLISQYESGKRQPKLETKKKIAAALNCDVSDIDEGIIVVPLPKYELTPERLERFKKDAEVLEIIKKKSSNEDYTEEEQQKILEYKKRMAESKEVVREKRLLMQENLKRLKSLYDSNTEQSDIDSDKTYIDPLAYEDSYSFASSKEEYEVLLRQRQQQGEEFLLSDYRKLNEKGQAEARKRVNELTEVPRYITPTTPPQE